MPPSHLKVTQLENLSSTTTPVIFGLPATGIPLTKNSPFAHVLLAVTHFVSKSTQSESEMAEQAKVLEEYENLRKDMQDGLLTEKGFHLKVRSLLTQLPSQSEMSKCKDAAEIFSEMKKAQEHTRLSKKKLVPLNKAKTKNILLKIKILPMKWQSKTRCKSGKYHKIILEEEPTKIIMNPSDGYDEIIFAAIKQFWSCTELKNVTYTLCYPDGSRWPKEDFEKEFLNLGNIPEIWKKTFFVGQRFLDTEEVVYVGTVSLQSPPCSAKNNINSLKEETSLEISNQSDFSSGFNEGQLSRSSKRKNPNVSNYVSLLKNFRLSSAKTPVTPENQAKSNRIDESHLTPTAIPHEYCPRVPYVENQITYNVDMPIGSGSFGSVYIGSYQGTPAAVKRIQINEEDCDLMHEIIVCLRLSHPNIVRFMAASKTHGFVLIANEYIHGASLDTVLYSKDNPLKLDEEDKKYVALEMSLAVEYIHSKHIIHQDLKPANILIEEKLKKAYLTDWGLANIRDTVLLKRGSRISEVFTGPLGGTALYMSPECTINYESCTLKSDMWSLGCTLLEMFTKMYPWKVKSANELRNLMSKELVPHAMEHLKAPFLDIIASCLTYSVTSRLTASELVQILKSADFIDLKKHYGYAW